VAWGVNCGAGPDGLLAAVERAVRVTRLPLIVQPNAGQPKEVGNRRIYLCSPEYLTEYARRYVALGAAAVGGCCGTTPEHIRAVAKAIKPLTRAKVRPVVATAAAEQKPLVPLAEKSQLGRRLAERQWIATVELLPPRGYDLTATVAKAQTLRDRGVHAINIPDGPRASSRISPLVAAHRIQQEAGIEAILHFCCRDRNLIGMQADLLGCAACGVRNILFVTGDPPKLGNYPNATGVFDTDSIGMAAVQRRLNAGLDLGGQPIEPQTFAVIGVGLDPTALDQQRELDRFRQKVEAGAEFAITQPVFEPDVLLRFLDRVAAHGLPILAGIWPLASYRNALFMRNEVPGVVVPDSIMQRMSAVESREGQLAVGIEIARESVARVRDRVCGIQVSAALGRIETALAVLSGFAGEVA
jgi:homocysteine S-methyltransferase